MFGDKQTLLRLNEGCLMHVGLDKAKRDGRKEHAIYTNYQNLQKNDGEETTHINGDEGEDDDIAKLNTAKELFNDVKDLL